MPYELRGNCVYNKDTGEKKGCSEDRATAIKHMRALYAAASGEKGVSKKSLLNKALVDLEEQAHYILEYEHDKPELQDLAEQILLHTEVKEAGINEDSIVRKVIDSIKGLISPPVIGESPIQFKQDSNGRTRVMMRVSNNFKDRHGEIITEEAHKAFAKHVTDNPNEMPEFWVWHIPGSRWGKADVVDYSDGFLTASGLVDVGMEEVAKSVARQDWGVSHGFKGLSLTGKGLIDYYKSFEFSPLPREAAANLVTGVMIANNKEQGMDPTKRQKLLDVGLSESLLDQWDKDSKGVSETLKALGIEFKDVDDGSDSSTGDNTPVIPDSTTNQETTLDTILQAVQALGTRLDSVESKQKSLEEGGVDFVAKAMEAAIKPGTGFVASKSSENAPSDQIVKKQSEWDSELDALLTGGSR